MSADPPTTSSGRPVADQVPAACAQALATTLERLADAVGPVAAQHPSLIAAHEQALGVLAAWQRQAAAAVNALHRIVVERRDGGWMFDDPARGLVDEPFVAGADQVFETLSRQHGGAQRLGTVFSARPFPGAGLRLVRQRAECDGAWYLVEPLGLEGWLCPATLRYFPHHPEQIFARIDPA
jgi:hypothetical protein